MGSGSSVDRVFTRTELEDIIKTAFQDDSVKTVTLSKLMTIANEQKDDEKKDEEKKDDKKKDEEKPEENIVPNIESTTKKVLDKRGKLLTLSQQTNQRIRELFDAMDSNEDKIVKKSEFVAALTKDGMIEEEEAKLLFEEIDVSRTGRITIAKFQQYSVVASINLMRKHFKEMDESKDRQIEFKEFESFFLRNNSAKLTERLWKKLDSNKNGKVNFKEWKVWAEDVCARDNLNLVFGE